MITVAEAKAILAANLPPRRVERVSLASLVQQAPVRVLAEDVQAREPSPQFTNSAMDGVAVRFADVEAGITTFDLLGESAAGAPFAGRVEAAGQAVRINTGAVLPEGVDTVIPVEEMEFTSGAGGQQARVAVPLSAVRRGQFVRMLGEEFQAGEVILHRGKALHAAAIALLAQQGITELSVYAPPVIVSLATGNEIQTTNTTQGFINDSNSPMLAAAVAESGGVVAAQHTVADSLEATVQAIRQAQGVGAGIILTTGGVSVGEHDVVKPAAAECGFETLFWRVQQKPGKPMFAARRGDVLLFALPGNPVSALMCYLHYVHPIIAWMRGVEHTPKLVEARLSQELVNVQGRAEFVRVRLQSDTGFDNRLTAYPLEKQESFMLSSMTNADGFVFLDIDEMRSAGASIVVTLF
jgi:molybdopterin molybdotransferase